MIALWLALAFAPESLAPAKPATANETNASNKPPQGCALHCSDSTLCERLTKIVQQKPFAEAQVSFLAQRLGSRDPLAACNPDLALNPASNAKLWTTATALDTLGPQHRYPTRLYYDTDKVQNGALAGDLYIRTDLDPSLVTGQVFEMAQTLYARGLRSIEGRLVFDLEPKRRRSLPPGFDQKDELVSYRTAIGAPSVNYNTFVVWVAPGTKRGDPATVAIVPPTPGLKIENRALTTRGSANRARVSLARDTKKKLRIIVEGKVGDRASERSTRLPRYDPTTYSAEVFLQALSAAGIKVRHGGFKIAPVPDRASMVLRHDSTALGELIRSVNKFSNNFMAEQILWSLAGPTSTPRAGLKVLEQFARRIGTNPKGLNFGNGSGLYANNTMSASQLVHLLRSMAQNFHIGPEFMASLAVMGVDGTTRRRLFDSPAAGWARVKTGTLDGVSALSGYVSAPKAEPIVFSILINGFASWEIGQARRRQDEMVLALHELLREPAPGR